MGLSSRRRTFSPLENGKFAVDLSPETRAALVAMAEDLVEVQTTDRPEIRRLFPTAYPDDPERDAGYQIFARDALIEKRREALSILHQTHLADEVTGDELAAWMAILNDFRLVLGTALDIAEDDDGLDLFSPDLGQRILFSRLGDLVGEMVEALTTSLPEPDSPEPPSST
jgi:hypothetical protein